MRPKTATKKICQSEADVMIDNDDEDDYEGYCEYCWFDLSTEWIILYPTRERSVANGETSVVHLHT